MSQLTDDPMAALLKPFRERAAALFASPAWQELTERINALDTIWPTAPPLPRYAVHRPGWRPSTDYKLRRRAARLRELQQMTETAE